MTTEQAPERLAYTTYGAIERYDLDGIFRARRVEATGWREQGRQIPLIAAQQCNQYPRAKHHSMSPPLPPEALVALQQHEELLSIQGTWNSNRTAARHADDVT